MWGILSGFELLLHLFSVFRISKAAQIIFLEFSKDELADLGDKITYGGSANPPVMLQVCVGFSCGQVYLSYCWFQSNF